MHVLLVYPDFYETVGGTPQHGSYSEGLASISAVLKSGGHRTSLYHIKGPVTQESFIESIRSFDPNLIAVSTRTSLFPIIKDYANWAKIAMKAPVILGGYHPTLRPEESIQVNGADMICIGEGEYPMLDLCERLERGKAYDDIHNIWTKRENGEVRINPVRPLIRDLDSLPMPDLDLFAFESLSASRMKTANVMISRGCPYSCTYCCNHKLKQVYPDKRFYVRFRSPERSVAALKEMLTRYPDIKYLNFMDNILPLQKKWFYEFADHYIKEIHLPFSCRDRADLLDRDVIRKLKEMGCYLIHFGVESGNDMIRNEVLKRRLKKEELIQAFDVCREMGISALSYNILNAPLENIHTSLETIKLNARLRANRMTATICYPYPGTALYDIAVEHNLLKPDFDYTEEVPIQNPGFSREDVLFVQRFFRQFVLLYRLTEKLPVSFRKQAEQVLDFFFTSKSVPRGLLVKLGNLQAKGIANTKVFLQHYFPDFYLWLRDTVVRANGGKTSSPSCE
jgi:radical SAM superfamily enzyme YgiQ (UPF0313 family)